MTAQLRLIVIASIVVLVLGIAGFHLWQDRNVRTKLAKALVDLERTENVKMQLQHDLLTVTQDAKVLTSSLKQAEVNRQALVKSYDVRLKKLMESAPSIPTECPKAIEWSIEHSSDLAWPSP